MISEQLAVSSEQCICTQNKHETVCLDFIQVSLSERISCRKKIDNKQRHCSLFLILFSLLFAFSLHAQDNIQIEIQPRFIQRLSWTPSNYALRYEVEIEREEDGEYRGYLLERTEESSIHISLPYGNYRFRVIPYDLLDFPGIMSEYQYIEIKPVVSETDEPVSASGRLFNFYLGASWFTHINIHGQYDWMKAPGQFLSGASLRLGLLTTNLSVFNLGVEIIPAWYSIDSLFNANKPRAFLLEGNFLAQKDLFNRRAAFILRVGAGFTLSLSDSPVASKNETSFYLNAGFSFIWYPLKNLYLEIGANYSYLFAIEFPTGRIRPFAGIGIRL